LFNRQINLDFNLIEFKDGIYNLQNNKFFKKNKIAIFFKSINLDGIATIKYFNKYYKYLEIPQF
jgi:hypothetical protein